MQRGQSACFPSSTIIFGMTIAQEETLRMDGPGVQLKQNMKKITSGVFAPLLVCTVLQFSLQKKNYCICFKLWIFYKMCLMLSYIGKLF